MYTFHLCCLQTYIIQVMVSMKVLWNCILKIPNFLLTWLIGGNVTTWHLSSSSESYRVHARKTTNLFQVTDTLFHKKLYQVYPETIANLLQVTDKVYNIVISSTSSENLLTCCKSLAKIITLLYKVHPLKTTD